MPDFFYNQALDGSRILTANVQAMFNDISAKVTNNFDLEQFRENSLRYKHHRVPFRIFAEDEKTGTSLFTGALDKTGAVYNWTNARIKHVQSVENAPNYGDAGHPVMHVHAQMISHDWEPENYNLWIGYSIDNGATFTAWTNSGSFFGLTRAHTNPMWSGMTTHYHTGVVTSYWPGSMYGKRAVHTVIAPLSITGLDIRTVTDWAVGILVNGTGSAGLGTKDVHALDVASIRLIARDVV